ncbi:MAG TPA: tannase/feruloyl esterase family alpha/beta hydrolase [Pyrinomonadaceae bacterium]|jgi:feruloyl esterase
MKQRFGLIIGLFLFLFIPAKISAQQSCESLTNLKLQDTIIVSATAVPAGSFKPPAGSNLESLELPAFCRVAGTIKPTPDSDIRFEVWLPASGWNGRFLQIGNGGLAGVINYSTMPRPLLGNFVVAATDDGHQASPLDGSWAIGHPEKVIDFGHRAVHLTAEKSKEIIKSFYGKSQKYSYFQGCSEGGREALMEAQRYPDDFDGIVVGAPGNYWTHLLSAFIWNSQSLLNNPASYIPPTKLKAVQDAALAACGTQDGVKDDFIKNPEACRFDPSILLCKNGDADNCLTDTQIVALKKIYAGPSNPRTGEKIAPGYAPGCEGQGGWGGPGGYIIGSGPGKSLNVFFGLGFFRGLVFENSNWDFKTFDFDKDISFTDSKLGATLNAVNPDLTGFKARGGKLIQYHGWGDASPPPLDSVNYYQSVAAKMQGLKKTQGFYRLFMAPGMNHCFGGPGPNSFGNVFGSPIADADHDVLSALIRWVENGKAPNKIIAAKYTDDDPKKRLIMTRPLCPYPQQARWTGKGSPNDAANFVCRMP